MLLNGQPVSTKGSNIVELRLPAGRHHLSLVGTDGARRRFPFDVVAGQWTNLATLTLEVESTSP